MSEESGRVLGLDVGDKRIGVAISDSLGLTAQGLPTISYNSAPDAVKAIKELSQDRQVSEIVVGLPRSLDGSLGRQAEKVLSFIDLLKNEIMDIPVNTWDERFSTQGAERILIDHGMNAKKRKEHIDKLSAQWILQGYLEKKRLTNED